MCDPCKHWFEGMVARSETKCPFCEIDELREALANLHSDYDIIKTDREELRVELTEVQAQKPDADYAAMYAWLRKQHWSDNVVGVVQAPKDAVKLGSYAPSGDLLDAFIREAMTKENL